MKIFLIGMPGSGKTTLGKELASHLAIDFIDLDAEIEKSEQKAIAEVFRQEGEVYFREVEAKLLRSWAGSAKSFVMATGGGAPCFHHGMDILNKNGLTIFLDCPVAALIDRVKKNHERPLLLTADENELREKLKGMLSERIDCYRKASIVIQNATLDTLLHSIAAKR